MKSKKPPKRYPLQSSPFYRLRGKAKFEDVVGILWDDVPELLDTKYYRVFHNDDGREIQSPRRKLARLHDRIGQLLARIEVPDYVYSKKGRSYVDNARAHRGSSPLVKTDIRRFYPSVTRQSVFRMFVDDFECALDIAHRLADICCYKQTHLPTGSTLSGRIAFLAKRQMFEEIFLAAQNAGCKMTVYVDDVIISGKAANKKLLGVVRKIIRNHGLRTGRKKTKTYAGSAAKLVTGVVIKGDEIRLPNTRHLKIHRARQAVQDATNPDALKSAQLALDGRLREAQNVLKD